MKSSRRVVITGMGALCNIGTTVDEMWASALKRQSQVSNIPKQWQLFNDFKCEVWAPLPPLDYAARGVTKAQLLKTDLVTVHQYITATEALKQAGFTFSEGDTKRTLKINELDNTQRMGVITGTAVGGITTAFNNHSLLVLGKNKKALEGMLSDEQKQSLHFQDWLAPRKLNPFAIPMLMSNAVSAFLGIQFSINGPNQTIDLACAAGSSAILTSFNAIKNGLLDIALTGGSEYLNDDYGASFRGFDVSGTLTQNKGDITLANRPFDKQRAGFLLAEGGSGALVLESYEHATKRGANILCEIVGGGNTFDAFSMMQPDPCAKQAQIAIEQAISTANISQQDINYINTHGTGTISGDESESALIKRLFGSRPLVASTKALTGHSIGAAGALEAIITAKTLMHQQAHGMPNLEQPINDLNFAVESQPVEAEYGLSQSFAFGGHNIALILKRINNEN